jgi:NADH-quinone oxidoreductase subunit J
MVLFLFAIMILNLGPQASEQERQWLQPGIWRGPAILTAILAAELIYLFIAAGGQAAATSAVEPQEVSKALFGPYLLGVELASLLLLAGLVGAYHLGQRAVPRKQGGKA